jgi:propionyl-CoA synthetase
MVDEAISMARFQPEHVLVCSQRIETGVPTTPKRDLDYAELRERHLLDEPVCLESGDPTCLLYTSGTTAKPKGIQRDTGGSGVALAASMRYVFAGEPGQTMFTAADIGWAVGHSYGQYSASGNSRRRRGSGYRRPQYAGRSHSTGCDQGTAWGDEEEGLIKR